ncbi:MAG: PAS domain S-box protein [Desulfobacter sp.]|nr:MAG: PAS domain S-box protein [Desulfobacter sp.]
MDRKELLDELARLKESETHYRILMDESTDPIFSFYPNGQYRYVNNAFATGVGRTAKEIIGRTIWDIFEKDEADKRFAVVREVFSRGVVKEIEVRVPLPTGDTWYLTTVKPIFNAAGEVDTVICISKNITSRKQAEIALELKHERLVKAMEEINALSGLLPICASCKKIRDDQGYWNRLESYIESHSDAQFSHGICPECSDRLYGGQRWYARKRPDRDS